MPAVIPLIIAGVSAGATVYGANKAAQGQQQAATTQANAANQAGQQQQATNNATLAFQEKQYADTQARLAPFRAIGTRAAGNLASLYGISMPPPAAPQPTGRTPQLPATVPEPAPGQQTIVPAFGAPQTPAPGAGQQTTVPAASLGTVGGGQSPLVTVKAPTGATRQVPQDQVSYYVSRGASVVPQGGM